MIRVLCLFISFRRYCLLVVLRSLAVFAWRRHLELRLIEKTQSNNEVHRYTLNIHRGTMKRIRCACVVATAHSNSFHLWASSGRADTKTISFEPVGVRPCTKGPDSAHSHDELGGLTIPVPQKLNSNNLAFVKLDADGTYKPFGYSSAFVSRWSSYADINSFCV